MNKKQKERRAWRNVILVTLVSMLSGVGFFMFCFLIGNPIWFTIFLSSAFSGIIGAWLMLGVIENE